MTIRFEFAGVVDAMERVVGLCETGWHPILSPMYYNSPSDLKLL